MADETEDLVAGLKADVDQHVASTSAPPQQSAAPDSTEDLVAGLKADVDRSITGGPPPTQQKAVKPSTDTYAQRLIKIESGGNHNAKAPGSSATGSGQFLDKTWVPLVRANRPDLAGKSDQELLAMRSDPQLSEQMVDAYGNQNGKYLKSVGIPATNATKYGSHWFGPETYAKIHNADPTTPIENIIGQGTAANNRLSGRTAGDVRALTETRMGGVDEAKPPEEPKDWGDTIEQAGENLIPSIGEAAKGVYRAVSHPLDTGNTLLQIGKGLKSKVDAWAGDKQDPDQKAKDEQLVDALAASYKDKYGSIDGFKNYLAKDPAGVLMDASTVLSGGGGLAAKLPGVVGKAGEIAANVGKAVNPLNPLGVVSDTVKKITSPAAAFTKTGAIAPKVDALIKKTTNGTMSGADLVDPDVKAAFAATIAKKGISEASVREGLLSSLELKTPVQAVTGKAVPSAAKEATAAAIEHNNDALDVHAAKLGGTPSGSDLGAALDQAHTNSLNNASAAYDKIRSMPGSFGKTMPEMPQLAQSIKQRFSNSGIPSADFKALADTGHTQAAAAIKLLRDRWGSGKTLMGKDFNGQEVLSMRKALNNLKASATGSDQKAISDVIASVDGHVSGLSNRGFFTNAKGQPVQGLSDRINSANAAYKAHFNTFDQSVNPSMRAAINQLKDKQTFGTNGQRLPSGDTAAYQNAQGSLAAQLMHPTKGANTYNQLKTALGGNTASIDQYVRSTILNGDKPVKNVSAMLNDPNSVASKAFASSPGDLAQARHIQAARDINNTKPAGGGNGLRDVFGGLANKGIGSIAGYETLGAPGLLAGPIAEHLMDMRAKSQALKGAKNASSLPMRAAKSVARRLTSPVGLATAHYKDQAQQVEDKIPRASGGKVDSDALVTRLISRWKNAKKATDATTKPLLNVPDASIVKALDIAQEHI